MARVWPRAAPPGFGYSYNPGSGAFTVRGWARAGGPELLVYVPPEVRGQPVASGGLLTVESRPDGSRLMHLAPAGGYSLTVRPAPLALIGC